MARDPAFLFYPGDWMGGTMALNRHQKGCYIDLLIAQFNNGPLSLETIKTVLGTDQATWTVLSKKFKQDSEGNFFSQRLVTEIEKRKAFTDSRVENGKKGGRGRRKKPYAKPSAKHMPNLPENENTNESLNEKNKNESDENETSVTLQMKEIWLQQKPKYPFDNFSDLQALYGIYEFIKEQTRKVKKLKDPHFGNEVSDEEILGIWQQLAAAALKDNFWKEKTLSSIRNSIQEFWNKANKHGKKSDAESDLNDKYNKMFAGSGFNGAHNN